MANFGGDQLRTSLVTTSLTVDEESLTTEQLAALRRERSAERQRKAFPLAVIAVKELMRDGLVEIGSYRDGFVPWSGSLAELEARLDRIAETVTFPMGYHDYFWLNNTLKGDELAEMLTEDENATE